MKKLLLGSSVILAGLVASAVSASAAIVCSGNVCWHTTERYTYPSDAGVTVYEDTWKPPSDRHVTFKEHTGRGYWKGETWIEIK